MNIDHDPVNDADRLHILPADIQNEGDIRIKLLRSPAVRHGLHHPVMQTEGCSYEAFPIAGGGRPHDAGLERGCGECFPYFSQPLFYRKYRVAVIGAVMPKGQPSLRINKNDFGGG